MKKTQKSHIFGLTLKENLSSSVTRLGDFWLLVTMILKRSKLTSRSSAPSSSGGSLQRGTGDRRRTARGSWTTREKNRKLKRKFKIYFFRLFFLSELRSIAILEHFRLENAFCCHWGSNASDLGTSLATA